MTRENIDLYMKDREAKKFTVIQAIVAHYGGLDRTNPYGASVFIKGSKAEPTPSLQTRRLRR